METIHLLKKKTITWCIFVSFVVQGYTQQPEATRRGWTMVGMENGTHEVLRNIDGSFGATNLPFTISLWLFDTESKQLSAPEHLQPDECVASLKKGYLPISIFSYPAGNFSVETHLFVNSHGDVNEDAVAYCRVIVQNNIPTQANAKLVLVLRPKLINGNAGAVSSVLFDKASMSVSVNDSLTMLFDEAPELFFGSSGDIASTLNEMIQSNKRNDSVSIETFRSEHNDASSAFVFPVSCSESRRRWQTTLQIPMSFKKSKEELTRLRRLNAEPEEADVARFWERRLRKDAVNISLPDEQTEHAYYASLAYLLICMDNGVLQRGPFTDENDGTFDYSQTYQALLQSGFHQIVIENLASLSFQSEKFIAQAATYYRFSRDKDFLRSVWKSILNIAGQHQTDSLFINELREAVFLARELGERDDAKRFKNAVKELENRIPSVDKTNGYDTAPNQTGINAILSSSVAADIMCSIRSSLLYEEKERLIIGSGIPKVWLQAGEKIQIENMPTHWGTFSYTILVGKDGKKISLKLTGDAEPPDGFILRLPFKENEIERATINRRETAVEDSGDIELETGTRSVSITLKKPLSK
ncbi:MAG: hypothetical protein HYZ34_06255 [Ignavibacteriae bacterium]|nr:hypothetical protein [Ignavibacteriota bacterium]